MKDYLLISNTKQSKINNNHLDFVSSHIEKSTNEKIYYKEKFNIPDDYDDYWYFRKFYKPDLPILKRLQYLDFKTYLVDDNLTSVVAFLI